MTPSDPHSSLTALRQLKEMLDAGTITPEEFEALKRQIVFGVEPALPLTPPTEPAATPGNVPPEPAAPEPEETIAPYNTVAPGPSELPPSPPANPDWLAAAAPGLPTSNDSDLPPLEERRNPLNLIFAIGGLLVFLGVVAYLMIGRPAQPDEHLTSGTQTAADSTAVVPEVGPQAEQLNLPPATAPDTVREVPKASPAPAPAASQFRTDSAAAPAPAAPASKTPAPASTTTTMSTDSTAIIKAP